MNDMSQEAIELRKAYYREYRRTHKEQIRKSQERYWEKKARELAEAEEEIEQRANREEIEL